MLHRFSFYHFTTIVFPLSNDFYHKVEINKHLTRNIHRFIINQKLQGPNTALTKTEFEFILAIVFCPLEVLVCFTGKIMQFSILIDKRFKEK